MVSMEAERIRSLLLDHHRSIRQHLANCLELAKGHTRGEPVRARLESALDRLRDEMAQHNAVETALVRSVLTDAANWGAALIDRMVDEHAAEHRAFADWLAEPIAEIAERMPELVEEIEAHMAAEERTFLAPVVLDSETVARRSSGAPS